MAKTLNWNSQQVTQGWQRGPTAFFHGLGFSADDFTKAQVGVGVPLLEGNLCNVHAYALGKAIAEGCQEAGLLGFVFGTPAVSDNITQALEGGNASLPSRNMIANAAEAVVSGHCYDAMIGMHCCDKNGPGFAMALARMNYPGLIVNGGSIRPGEHNGKQLTILDVYDSQAACQLGRITSAELETINKHACPGPGGCGIAASFNTWGIALEAMGLSLPDTSSIPAEASEKMSDGRRAGMAVRKLLEMDLRPRDILTRTALLNTARTIAAIGGSTNGLLHLMALAREAQVPLTLRDIQPILRSVPVLCSFAPRGQRTMVDLYKLGGTSMLLRHLMEAGLLDGSPMTVTGRTLAENLATAPTVPADQDLIAPASAPFKPHADMQICFGNLAPEGIVFKVSSMKAPQFRGRALCFDDVREVVRAVDDKRVQPGSVIILRGLGPVASGMPEVLVATAALAVPELDGKVAFLSDTRVSGVSHGAIGVHCSPEAAVGGPIGLVQDGDEVSFDLLAGTITWHVSDDEAARRRAAWRPPTFAARRGYLEDFAATASQAHHGCVSTALYPATKG